MRTPCVLVLAVATAVGMAAEMVWEDEAEAQTASEIRTSTGTPELRWSVSAGGRAGFSDRVSDCSGAVAAVRQSLEEFDIPPARRLSLTVSRGFSWVVICDERAWFRLKAQPEYRRVATRTGMTDFPNHVVYLNGFGRSPAELRETVAHEIGHQICGCADESVAEQNRMRLEDQARRLARQAEQARVAAATAP